MMITSETSFRILLAILLAAFASMVWHSRESLELRGWMAVKDERGQLSFFQMAEIVLISTLFYVFTPWLDFASLAVPHWLRWVGSMVLSLGIVGIFWSHRTLEGHRSGAGGARQRLTLVTAGPYRRVRHPIYTAMLLVGVGVSLVSANWLVAVSNLGAVAGTISARIPVEEAIMLEQFGDTYREYRQGTGCLLPRWRGGRHGKA